MQASVYIPIKTFQEFHITEDIMFRINLNMLVECLFMFSNIVTQGSTVALQLLYKVRGLIIFITEILLVYQ